MCLANPVVAAGKIPKKKTRPNPICQFCSTEFPTVDEMREHEDVCAPPDVTRYMCPSYAECGQDCFYYSIDEDRARRHARTSNRREDDPMRCPIRDVAVKPLSENILEIATLH
jgi:hypothetical protein